MATKTMRLPASTFAGAALCSLSTFVIALVWVDRALSDGVISTSDVLVALLQWGECAGQLFLR